MNSSGYLQFAKRTTAGGFSVLPTGGAVLVWGAKLYHTGAADCVIQLGGANDAIHLGTAGAGSTGVMFNVPIHTSVDPDLDSVTASAEVYLYYTTIQGA